MSLGDNSKALLAAAMEKLNLSARAYHRIIKVSRTIADLAGAPNILPEHILQKQCLFWIYLKWYTNYKNNIKELSSYFAWIYFHENRFP